MQIIPLYRYFREDGGVNVSPIKPNKQYTVLYRLVADENKVLTQDNIETCDCIDTESIDLWYEIEKISDENNET